MPGVGTKLPICVVRRPVVIGVNRTYWDTSIFVENDPGDYQINLRGPPQRLPRIEFTATLR
jgi:hypothetical protein